MKNSLRVLVVVPAALAAPLLVGVGGASAAANQNAVCVGQLVSGANQVDPGSGGQGAAFFARHVGLGFNASHDFCPIR